MSNSRFVYTDEDGTGLMFVWHGGAYIDIGTDPAVYGGEEFQANDVINVYDYAKGEPDIPRTLDAFEARCLEYLEEHAPCERCGDERAEDSRLCEDCIEQEPLEDVEEIEKYLCAGRNLDVPCSRYGTDTKSCAPVAALLALIICECNGDEVRRADADHAMGLVVNDQEDVARLINENASLAGYKPEDYLNEADLDKEDA